MSALECVTTDWGGNSVTPSLPAQVLVIDDDAAVCSIVTSMLMGEGYESVRPSITSPLPPTSR
jgi:PleD family two-component response regulator